MSEPAIRVANLSKRYRIGARLRRHTLREAITEALLAPVRRIRTFGQASHSGNDDFWALNDVSFEVQPGEVVGVIGANGAGKSTLLKILSQITYPTAGRVELRGRVGSLLEVGTGFHRELSGRENIYMNGAILGMARSEIERKFDAIVDFAGVEKFIDTPVKHYSSGMYVRLAFAVAAHLEPEILLIDEVLAVGDAEFQKRCLGRMGDIAKGGRTLLFVSHNMAAIESLCGRVLLLSEGRVGGFGGTEAMVRQYLQRAGATAYDVDLSGHQARVPGMQVVARRIRLVDVDGAVLCAVSLGSDLRIELELEMAGRRGEVGVAFHFHSSLGQRVMTCHSGYQCGEPILFAGAGVVGCTIQRLALFPGQYSITVSVVVGGDQVDRIDPALLFDVLPRDLYGTGRLPPARDGVFAPEVRWDVRS